MPVYVYGCKACGREFEIEQRITADALTDCDACGTEGSLRRIIQPVAVAFKGAGFHINDYADKSSGASKPAEEAAPAAEKAPESAPAPDVKTEAKPAAPAKPDP